MAKQTEEPRRIEETLFGAPPHWAGFCLIIAGGVAPALLIVFFFPQWTWVHAAFMLPVATVAGAAGGALFLLGRGRAWAGAIGGALAAAGALAAMLAYANARPEAATFELSLAAVAGLGPGALVGLVLWLAARAGRRTP